MSHPILSTYALRFGWPGHPPLWSALNLELAPGLWAIVGDEGSGKTTLLRLLAGELAPDSGRIELHGRPAAPRALAAAVAWTDPRTDAFEAVVLDHYLADLPRRFPGADRALLQELVAALSLDAHRHKTFHMLSTGSRRKAWIAAAIASMAPVVLIDQPFAALDGPSVRCVTELLADAAHSQDRLFVIADFEPPHMVPPGHTISLDASA